MKNGEIRACLPLPRDADLAGACINLTLAWRLVTAHCVKAADKSRKLIKFLGFALSIVCTQNSFAALTPGATPVNSNVDAVENPLFSQIIGAKKRRGIFHAVFNFRFVIWHAIST